MVRKSNDHIHEAVENKNTNKKKGRTYTRSYTSNSCLLTVSEGIAAKLPKLDSLKRTIQPQRQQNFPAHEQPLNLLELEIPKEYRIEAQ